jgi:hypothetical protein
VSSGHEIKSSLAEIQRYADDYNHRNFAMKKIMAPKLKAKLAMHINSLSSITRMLENSAHNHNQLMLQQQVLEETNSQKVTEIK